MKSENIILTITLITLWQLVELVCANTRNTIVSVQLHDAVGNISRDYSRKR